MIIPYPTWSRIMARAAVHPEPADLQAFALGSLSDDDSHVSVESHVAGCSTCQEMVAGASGDTFVELLRRAHARPVELKETLTEASVLAATPETLPPT
jgi:hypothetical protein